MTDSPAPGRYPDSDAALAAMLATTAGQLLVEVREQLTSEGAYAWQVMDSGDLAAQTYLARALHEARPDDAVLSEEGAEDPRRFAADRVWIIDPLDGTNEYGETGRSDWAVHIALWDRDHLAAGAVSLPAHGITFATDPPPTLPPMVDGRRLRLVTSRNRAPYAAVLVANALDCDAYRLGSAGAKAMAVVLGEADIYLHDGGMYQWDSAAPTAVALAAGLHASRIDGSPLVYNDRNPWLPDFLICRVELAEQVLEAIWGDRRRVVRGESVG